MLLLARATPSGRCNGPVTTATQEQPAEAVDEEKLASCRQGVEVESLCMHSVSKRVLAHGIWVGVRKEAVVGSEMA